MSDPENNVTLDYLRRLLRLGGRPGRELAADGTFVRVVRGRYDLEQSVGNYAERIRGVAAGRGGEAAQLDLTQERARLAKAQTAAAEFKLARERGEYVLGSDVVNEWTKTLTMVRQHMLSIPSKIAQRMTQLSRDEVAMIDDILREKMTDAAEAVGELELEPR